jgi:hypothetical protein
MLKWDSKSRTPELMGKLKCTNLPLLHEIKGFARTEFGLTLVMENEQFVFLQYEIPKAEM